MVANGHYEEPYAPEIPGAAEWRAGGADRTVTHAKAYDAPEAFAGKAVLVVGGRSSGAGRRGDLLAPLLGGCPRRGSVSTLDALSGSCPRRGSVSISRRLCSGALPDGLP